jgi:two-component system, OmpR family, sensor histidine kinase KdpD
MPSNTKHGASSYVIAIFLLALVTLSSTPLIRYFDLANIVMVFLLVVFLVAVKLGRGPAIMSAVLAVALFDVFFVPPRFSFAVHDAQYLLTFFVMLCVGLTTAHLTTRLQQQAEEADNREQATHRLYELARDLAGATSTDMVAEVVKKYFASQTYQASLHLMNADGNFTALKFDVLREGLAHSALQQDSSVNISQLSPDGRHGFVIPIKSGSKKYGVMLLNEDASYQDDRFQVDQRQLAAVADLVLIALERLHYVELAQAKQVEVASERLRSSILSALSHDLRTPLTGLVGMSDALAISAEGKDAKIHDSACAIREQAKTMNNLLSNLLDMARLHAGKVELRKDWQLFEDVIGVSLQLLKPALTHHPIAVQLDAGLPLVNFDAVLIERVLCNLIENAAKFSPLGQSIEIRGFVNNEYACISVCDHGQGFPEGQKERLFQMFSRGEAESKLPGVGMGLAICKAIMDAHGGKILIDDGPNGDSIVTIALPIGTPPEIKLEPEGSL